MEPFLINSFGKGNNPGLDYAELGRKETNAVFRAVEESKADFGGKDIFLDDGKGT